jgi:long-chain acyl-CoA synthetase
MYRQIIKGIKKSGKYTLFKILCRFSNFLMFFHIDLRRKLFKEVLDGISPNMRTIIYGSASSDKKVIHLFNTIGIDMLQGYGLTETAPVISCESDKFHFECGSSGYPLYNEEVKIDEPNSEGIGEILVKGPNIMLGYYNNETATKNSFKDGWFCTGDLGKFGKDGRLFVTGRKKDLIVLSNGKNVYPEELEAILNKFDLISESMVYEKDDKICAKIVYATDDSLSQALTKDEIYNKIDAQIKIINKDLPVYKYIREFFITDKPLIKTTTQKIKRHEEMKNIR